MIRIILAIVFIWMVVSCVNKYVPLDSFTDSKTGTATSFAYQDIYGRQGNIDQFRKHYIVLHFWATWCPPCVREMPLILMEAARTPDAVFLLISVDDSKLTVQQFIDKMPIRPSNNVVIIHDPTETITAGIFNVHAFPTNYILAPDDTLRLHDVGVADWTNQRNNIRIP